ncbi:TPA: BppU family phage baseplate upper protein [Enterococcus faecium]|uniref:BppU family phage baseplate upper protein n=1 Tax=Enterococcus faecium TaxID=1352 RepID=UPI000F84B16B|nr:BppU family phage baseplate upper protein [Enterococcus faecium]HAQ4669822.1 BppU family phage baseplate upper protein [Enterococcus faecium]HAR1305172.1 BppU family phage baseplate upper protein [Enterococcus faecium]HAR1486007.1 BppU family phage baseplate upper protein [Enterococcus faecium]HAR1488722.1 BppU family phage baseplate upper protein [Enterococcus faecium]HAR1491460.1 BppU family phage baseplate upper protein [Enterococcus faecium]
MADRKVGEITVPTEPVSRATKITGFTFKSYDKNAGVLQFNIENQDGSPTDLIDATVRLFMYIYQGEEKKEFPIFDNQIITESYMQGIVKYPIPDMLLSYEGKVDVNVYIDFPDGSHTDNLAFTFNIEKSVIDDNVQLNGEYYFKDFQQLLDGVKQEATDAVNAALTNVDSTIEKANQQINEFVEGATQAIDQTVDEVTEQLQATQTKIDTVSQNVTSAQNNLKAVEDKMNQTNQQIGALGKLKKMYSNSIEFGGYDYSGNPNIAPVINDGNVSSINNTWTKVTPHGTFATCEKIGTNLSVGVGMVPLNRYDFSKLTVGKQYTLTIPIRINADFTGEISSIFIRMRCVNTDGDVVLDTKMLPSNTPRDEFVDISNTFTVPSTVQNSNNWYCQVGFSADSDARGTVDIGYDVKLEEGSTATPYQPNLLDAPYYLSKVALGENIANKSVAFPIESSAYEIYKGNTEEDLVIGQTYTITLKGTKPVSYTFAVHNDETIYFGDLMPVEGLTDVWSLTFTPTKIASNAPKEIRIFQYRSSIEGACRIDWLKIEKGNTRTPNISQFKYFGEGLKDSNNPNDYSWDVTPEYTEKGLNNTVSLTEPQSVEGLKNFEDGLQIAGKEVATVPEDTGWVNLTAINGHSWNKQGQIRRIGKLVMFRGSLKGSTLSTQDFCMIPEGFRPSNPTDNYEYQFLLPPQSSNTLDNGGMAYIRPNGVCGLPSFRGTVNLFLAPIQYYID